MSREPSCCCRPLEVALSFLPPLTMKGLQGHPLTVMSFNTLNLMMVLPDDHREGSQIVASYMPGGD